MITLLRKLFIKDYQDVEKQKVRTDHGKLASLFGLVTNVFLFISKLVFGFLTNSISIITDSINNLSDSGNSVVSLVGFKLSAKPADKEHPFGHQRLEYLAGLIISIVIVVLGANLLVQSVIRIIEPVTVSYSVITFIFLGAAILLKAYQAFLYYRIGKLINSITLKATALDSLMDVFATSAVLASALVSFYFKVNIDGYMGVLVAATVIYSGIKMVKETIDPLIGKAPDKKLVNNILKDVTSVDGVLGYHDLRLHSYGPTKIFMTLHIEVKAKDDIIKTHEMVDKIETIVRDKYNVDLVIHMDPIDQEDEETTNLLAKLQVAIKEVAEELSFHDLRIVKEKGKKKAIFEIVVPFDFKLTNEEIKETLLSKVKDNNIDLEPEFETPFLE